MFTSSKWTLFKYGIRISFASSQREQSSLVYIVSVGLMADVKFLEEILINACQHFVKCKADLVIINMPAWKLYFGKAALLLSYFSALIEKLMKKKNCIKLVNIGFPKKMQSSSSVG